MKSPPVLGTCPFCGEKKKLTKDGLLPRHRASLSRRLPKRPTKATRGCGTVRCPETGKPPAEQRRAS